jgi:purine-binding chemotaxis protein CheW
VNGKFVILLNVNKVLSTEEIGQMGQVAASASDVAPVN